MISVHDLSFPLFQIYGRAQTEEKKQSNVYIYVHIYIYNIQYIYISDMLDAFAQHTQRTAHSLVTHTKWNISSVNILSPVCRLFIYLYTIYIYKCSFDTLNAVYHFGSFQFTHWNAHSWLMQYSFFISTPFFSIDLIWCFVF